MMSLIAAALVFSQVPGQIDNNPDQSSLTSVSGADLLDGPSVTVSELQDICTKGMNGDNASMRACRSEIMKQAEQSEIKETGDINDTVCLQHSYASIEDLVWNWMDYVNATNPKPDSLSSSSVMSAMLTTYPCGWQEK